MDSDKLVL